MYRLTLSSLNRIINLLEMFPEFLVMKDVDGYKRALTANVKKGQLPVVEQVFILNTLGIQNTNVYKPSVNKEKVNQIMDLLLYIRSNKVYSNDKDLLAFQAEFMSSKDNNFLNVPLKSSVYDTILPLLSWNPLDSLRKKIRENVISKVYDCYLTELYLIDIQGDKYVSLFKYTDLDAQTDIIGVDRLQFFRKITGKKDVFVPIPKAWLLPETYKRPSYSVYDGCTGHRTSGC